MLERGDLIEIQRAEYCHWAVYIGNGDVFHVTGDDDCTESAIFGASFGFSAIAIAKKDTLTDVALGATWIVNNHLDKKYNKKSPDDIVKEAELLVGKKMPYNLLTNNCEHLITNLRYGKPESMQVRDAICVEPKPGDLIEIKRTKPNFCHWAVYIGNGYVIHLTGYGVSAKGAIYGSSGFGVYTVKKGLLTDVANGDKWLVNNQLDEMYKPKSPDDIVKEAELQVGKKMPYNIVTFNCEHFVTNLRYGKPESRQVQKVIRVATSGMCLIF